MTKTLSGVLGLSKKNKWYPKAQVYDFRNAILSHTIFHKVKESGFFGSTYSENIFEIQENNCKIPLNTKRRGPFRVRGVTFIRFSGRVSSLRFRPSGACTRSS